MFRLLIGLILICLIIFIIWVGTKLVSSYYKDNEQKKNHEEADELDTMIKDFELRIELAELRASKGSIDAEKDLIKYRSALEKAKKIKEKLKNN